MCIKSTTVYINTKYMSYNIAAILFTYITQKFC